MALPWKVVFFHILGKTSDIKSPDWKEIMRIFLLQTFSQFTEDINYC